MRLCFSCCLIILTTLDYDHAFVIPKIMKAFKSSSNDLVVEYPVTRNSGIFFSSEDVLEDRPKRLNQLDTVRESIDDLTEEFPDHTNNHYYSVNDALDETKESVENYITTKLITKPFNATYEVADFCLGCFWSPDYSFSQLNGVYKVTVGYAGGTESNPTYNEIKDYTETIRVEYNPTLITYDDLLKKYIELLGPPIYDNSNQYRSRILFHTETQRISALRVYTQLTQQYNEYESIYLAIEPYTDFYQAEEYHQKFIEKQLYKEEQEKRAQYFSGTGL